MHRPTLPTLIAIGAAVCLSSLISLRALAGSTDPTLAIGQLRARPAGQSALLELTGIFHFDDVVQMDFRLTVVAWQGDAFVRFRPGSAAQSGSFAQLSDGLQISEIAALEAAGVDEPDAELLSLEPNKLLMAMPPTVLDGTINAVLYVQVPGEGTFVSNQLSTTLVGVGGGS